MNKRFEIIEVPYKVMKEFFSLSQKPLWENNKECPECGMPIFDNDIKACETGFSYCSEDCCNKHVNELVKKEE